MGARIALIALGGLFCVATIGATRADPGIETIKRINAEVNRTMFYRPDFGGDVWRLSGRYGDCEDFALRKMQRLAAAGIPSRIGIYTRADGIGHAVAVAGGAMLDNNSDELQPVVNFKWQGELRGGKIYVVEVNGKPYHGTLLALRQPIK